MDVVRRLGVSPPMVNNGVAGPSSTAWTGCPTSAVSARRAITEARAEQGVVTTREQVPPDNDSH